MASSRLRRSSQRDAAAIQDRVYLLIRLYRVRGHRIAQVNPLGLQPEVPPELQPEAWTTVIRVTQAPLGEILEEAVQLIVVVVGRAPEGISEVHYYFEADADAAERLKTVASQAVRDAKLNALPFQLRPLLGLTFGKPKPGTLELWIGLPAAK